MPDTGVVHFVVCLSNMHTGHICQAVSELTCHTSVPNRNRMTLLEEKNQDRGWATEVEALGKVPIVVDMGWGWPAAFSPIFDLIIN